MSLTPITLQNEFAQIHPSHYPDKGHRGRLFEKALQHLAQWWSQTFFEVLPTGHIRNHTFDEVQSKLESFDILYDDKELDDDTLESVLSTEIERIRGPKSLMKHALNRSGSRDVSAQLFTSLCRAIGLPARLVVSLQSVPWQPSIGKPKPTYTRKSTKGKAPSRIPAKDEGDSVRIATKGKSKASVSFEAAGQRLDDAPVQMSEKARGKQRAEPVIKLRKQKDKGHRLGDAAPSRRLGIASASRAEHVLTSISFSRSHNHPTCLLDRGLLPPRLSMDACRPRSRIREQAQGIRPHTHCHHRFSWDQSRKSGISTSAARTAQTEQLLQCTSEGGEAGESHAICYGV